ncbi:MAG TPA: NIPSNAP family protein [Acidimicrobiales bacterium]
MRRDRIGQLVELRNYTLRPAAAAAFVEHFERHLLASQEAHGMDVVGQFTVPGDDARFVWIRRYLRPSTRGAALRAFYSGPVWAEHGPRANELMVDHTDVHLLVPDPSGPPFAARHRPHSERAEPDAEGVDGAGSGPASTVVAALYDLGGTDRHPAGAWPAALVAAADATSPDRAGAGVTELGRLATARVPNEFARLPVHDDPVAVWLLADTAGGDAGVAAAESVAAHHRGAVLTIRLTPTPRSTLR